MSGSGYDIKKFCDSSIAYFWNENYGHIYPVLQRMEDEALITKEVKQTEGRPAKNLYSITQKGKEVVSIGNITIIWQSWNCYLFSCALLQNCNK